jgi:hypothetical protein
VRSGTSPLQLRISDLRSLEQPDSGRPLSLGPLAVGTPCHNDADAICVPLG